MPNGISPYFWRFFESVGCKKESEGRKCHAKAKNIFLYSAGGAGGGVAIDRARNLSRWMI
jgi:hypothetical protein